MKKIVLPGNNKPHMTSQLRKAIMKRSRLKNKSNKSGKPADKTDYKTQRSLVVKLNKEVNKTKFFLKLCKPFFTEKSFHYKQKFTLKTKRDVTSSETTIANILRKYYKNINYSCVES